MTPAGKDAQSGVPEPVDMRLADASIDPKMGMRLYCERYGVGLEHPSVAHIVRALGSFHDIADDPWLAEAAPDASFAAISDFWKRRQPELAAWLASTLQ